MTDPCTICIATQFSSTPGARYRKDGDYSGEEFRERFLVPAMKAGVRISIQLDGTMGYATSFLEEAFGGLARQFGIKECLDRISFVSLEDDILEDEIKGYIKDAR